MRITTTLHRQSLLSLVFLLLSCKSNTKDVVVQLDPLPPQVEIEGNAWSVWETIPKDEVDLGEFVRVARGLTYSEELGNGDALEVLRTEGKQLKLVLPSLEILSKGTSEPNCRSPVEPTAGTRNPGAQSLAMFSLTKIQLAQVVLLTANGQTTEAIDALEKTLRLGQKLAACDGTILSFTIAISILDNGFSTARFLADSRRLSDTEMRRLMAVVAVPNVGTQHLSANLKSESLQAGYLMQSGPLTTLQGQATYLLRASRLFNAVPKAEALLALFVELDESNEAARKIELAVAAWEEDIAFVVNPDKAQVQATMAILDKHPKPFDTVATHHLYENGYAVLIATDGTYLSSSAKLQKQSIEVTLALKADLGVGVSVLRDPARIHTQQAIAKFLRVPNPIGRLLHAENLAALSRVVPKIDAQIVEVMAVRAVLLAGISLCQYVKSAKDAPDSLSSLTIGKQAKPLPLDPYSGDALRYSKYRPQVWSIGEGEINLAGDSYANSMMTFQCPEAELSNSFD